jgi:hypothetical protein
MKLKDYLDTLGMRPSVAAASFGGRIGTSRQVVERWRDGSIPSEALMRRIYRATGGLVQPNDFYSLPQSPKST